MAPALFDLGPPSESSSFRLLWWIHLAFLGDLPGPSGTSGQLPEHLLSQSGPVAEKGQNERLSNSMLATQMRLRVNIYNTIRIHIILPNSFGLSLVGFCTRLHAGEPINTMLQTLLMDVVIAAEELCPARLQVFGAVYASDAFILSVERLWRVHGVPSDGVRFHWNVCGTSWGDQGFLWTALSSPRGLWDHSGLIWHPGTSWSILGCQSMLKYHACWHFFRFLISSPDYPDFPDTLDRSFNVPSVAVQSCRW